MENIDAGETPEQVIENFGLRTPLPDVLASTSMRSGNVSKVLFGVNVPRSASRFLTGHDVAFADKRGWRELTSGDLYPRRRATAPG